MKNYYIKKDNDENIIGIFARPQFSGQEKLLETDPQIKIFKKKLEYDGITVSTKKDVDTITRMKIINTGIEEKAKTEKLLAGDKECQIWEQFLILRSEILSEGEIFISKNNLT